MKEKADVAKGQNYAAAAADRSVKKETHKADWANESLREGKNIPEDANEGSLFSSVSHRYQIGRGWSIWFS